MASNLTVRKVDFNFPDDINLYLVPSKPELSLYIAAFSLIIPYVERYIIKTMLKAKGQVVDDELMQDLTQFCKQEANHHLSHERINSIIINRFDSTTVKALEELLADINTEYEGLQNTKSLKFNLAYAEGFESMTCAWALAMSKSISKPHEKLTSGWRELLDWHCLEEIEHRTVAFNVYNHVVGKYAYRVIRGVTSQIHYLRIIHRVYSVMLRAKGFKMKPYVPLFIKAGNTRYLATFLPGYNPATYPLPTDFEQRLEYYKESSVQ